MLIHNLDTLVERPVFFHLSQLFISHLRYLNLCVGDLYWKFFFLLNDELNGFELDLLGRIIFTNIKTSKQSLF